MAFQPEKDLSCPICQEVFKDPVVLSCSHSFCRLCLSNWFTEKPTKECPVCNRRSSRTDPPCNLVLRNLCEAFVKERIEDSSEAVCSVHSEKLKLFCLDHQQPVCVVCRDSKAHRNHSFSPIEEAAQDLREELNKSLLPLKEKLQKAEEVKQEFDLSLAYIKKQSRSTERQIEAQFLKLHDFLSEQQEVRMRALREEEEQKTQRMKNKMAAVSREIEALSETIRATEEQLRAADVSFLLRYKAAVDRVQHCPLLEELQLGPGVLNEIDQAKHLGNLGFNIWTNMKRLVQYTPVILDPNSARDAVLSDDLTSFSLRIANELETTKKSAGMVYGSKGFDSGSHSWDVEVGDNEKWVLGVVTDWREEGVKAEDVKGWDIELLNGEYGAGINTGQGKTSLKLDSNPQRIRVHLDCNKYEVTFYDADTNTHIHTFTQICQKKLFPFFYTGCKSPIRILPQEV